MSPFLHTTHDIQVAGKRYNWRALRLPARVRLAGQPYIHGPLAACFFDARLCGFQPECRFQPEMQKAKAQMERCATHSKMEQHRMAEQLEVHAREAAEREQQRENRARVEQQEAAERQREQEEVRALKQELARRLDEVAAREREVQRAEQEHHEAATIRRSGEKRKQEHVHAEPRQSAEGRRASASHFTSNLTVELQAWLTRHGLDAVEGVDQRGWSALHHVAQDAKSDESVAGIFEELCNHEWTTGHLDRPTGEADAHEHLPVGWTALHLLANGSENGIQRAPMVRRFVEMRANPMECTARGATPLHTAAGTVSHEVARVLLAMPGVNVNAKNNNNKTPFDMASSNKKMQALIAEAGGRPSPDATGASSRDEPNSRARGGHTSDARRQRAAAWQQRRR